MSEKKADGILEKKRTFKDYFMSIGPAIIIAAVVIGPGSVTTIPRFPSFCLYCCISVRWFSKPVILLERRCR